MRKNRDYVLWRRVSTKQQGESELGLEAQTAIALHFMEAEPVKIFTDVYSGRKLRECRGLRNAIKYCKENGYLLVVAKSDRFRNTIDGLTILDEVGERNLYFCDLATADRSVLTMMFAMWERQAIMISINTKLALAELKKRGVKLGRPAVGKDKDGNDIYDMTAMTTASAIARADAAAQWKAQSVGYKWAMDRVREGWPDKKIVEEFNKLHKYQPDVYCSRTGKPLSFSRLLLWRREANQLFVS